MLIFGVNEMYSPYI